MLPAHGKMTCRACFVNSGDNVTSPHPEWKMVNDPGAWGGREPEYLVLGFSKGSTQAGIYENGRFENVAFSGMRPRLTRALQVAGVLKNNETVDEKIADPGGNVAFGSLIRCSVTRRHAKKSRDKGQDVYECSGQLITKSFQEIPHVIKNCSERYLLNLPATVKAVLLLGNSDQYVQSCQDQLRELFPQGFERINPMAVKADGRIWVHLAHPSGSNGHFFPWLEKDTGPGLKRRQAQDALGV